MDWNKYSCQEQQQSRVDHERQVDHAEQMQQQECRDASVRYHLKRDESDFQHHQDQVQHEREDMAHYKHDRSVTKEMDRRFEAREDRQIEQQVQKMVDRSFHADFQHHQDQVQHEREDMAHYKHDRSVTKEMDRRFEAREDRQIEQQVQKMVDRSFHAADERQHRLDEKTARNDVVCEQMVHNQEDQNDRDDARTERHHLEDNARDDQDDQDRRDDSAQSIRELTAGLDGQVEYKRVVAVEQKAEDVRFKKASDQILADGDARELEEKRKAREINLQYSADLRRQIEEDKARKLAEKNSYNAWTGHY